MLFFFIYIGVEMYLEIRKDGKHKSLYLFKVLDRDLCNDFFFFFSEVLTNRVL